MTRRLNTAEDLRRGHLPRLFATLGANRVVAPIGRLRRHIGVGHRHDVSGDQQYNDDHPVHVASNTEE